MKISRFISRPGRPAPCAQGGYILVVLLLFVTLLVIAAMATAPSVVQQIRRDREEETIHRGTQYARAIKRFYKKFGRYPSRLEELENTNHLRFLRRRYKDPLTAEGAWRIIHFGEAKVVPTGFTAVRPAPAPGTPAAPATPGPAAGPGGAAASPLGTTQPKGPTFGGGPIVGVASTSEQTSIKELNGKNHYNEWEFVYDPRFDVGAQQLVPGVPGQPAPKPGVVGPSPSPQPQGPPSRPPQ